MEAKSEHPILIAVDLDEVLGEFLPLLIKYHNDLYGTKFQLKDFFSYHFSNVWGGSDAETSQKVDAFFQSPLFADPPTIPQAFNVLSKYSLTYQRSKPNNSSSTSSSNNNDNKTSAPSHPLYEFAVVTSRQSMLEKQTRIWLEKHYPNIFKHVVFGNAYGKTGVKKRKSQLCAELGAAAIIDDSLAYALDCSTVLDQVFLFDLDGHYSWNQTGNNVDAGLVPSLPPHVLRVNGWQDIDKRLATYANELRARHPNGFKPTPPSTNQLIAMPSKDPSMALPAPAPVLNLSSPSPAPIASEDVASPLASPGPVSPIKQDEQQPIAAQSN